MAGDNTDDPISDPLVEGDADEEVHEADHSADENDHHSGNGNNDFADQFQLMKNSWQKFIEWTVRHEAKE